MCTVWQLSDGDFSASKMPAGMWDLSVGFRTGEIFWTMHNRACLALVTSVMAESRDRHEQRQTGLGNTPPYRSLRGMRVKALAVRRVPGDDQVKGQEVARVTSQMSPKPLKA